jgi:hypothetical protein
MKILATGTILVWTAHVRGVSNEGLRVLNYDNPESLTLNPFWTHGPPGEISQVYMEGTLLWQKYPSHEREKKVC